MTLHRSAGYWVKKLKKWSRNKDLVNLQGTRLEALDTDYILHALNQGKNNIQEALASTYQGAFASFTTALQLSSLTTQFAIPGEAMFGNRVIAAWFGTSAADADMSRLVFRPQEHWSYSEGAPSTYYVGGANLVLSPVPSSGFIKLLIQRKDDDLDIRRGMVASVASQVITLTSDDLIDETNKEALVDAEYVCVCSWDGSVIAYNLPVMSFDPITLDLTIRAGYSVAGVVAAGDYITIGQNTATHSQLPKVCEDYYVTWAMMRILNQDSSDDAINELPILQSRRETIVEGFADNASMITPVQYGSLTGDWFSEEAGG